MTTTCSIFRLAVLTNLWPKMTTGKSENTTLLEHDASRLQTENRDFYPLSLAQQQIWVGQKAAGSTPIYNIQTTYHIHAGINASLFQEACERVVAGSDILQTVFVQLTPIEVVQKRDISVRANCELARLSLDEGISLDESIKRWAKQQGLISLDLSQCCFRFRLLQLPNDTFIFYLSIHHIIVDGSVLQLLWHAIEKQYHNLLKDAAKKEEAGKPDTDLVPFKICCKDVEDQQPLYRDHVEEQIRHIDSPERQARLLYWQNKAASQFHPSGFYGNYEKPGYETNRNYWDLDSETRQKVSESLEHPVFNSNNQLSKNKTLFVLVATALLITNSKCQSNSHQRLGFPARTRGDKAFQKSFGIFVSLGFLDIQISSSETVETLAAKVDAELGVSMDNLDSSIQNAKITRAFTSSLNIVIAKANSFGSVPVTAKARINGYYSTGNALDLHINDFTGNGDYSFLFDMAESVFSLKDQKRYIKHFKCVFEQIMSDPTAAVENITVLSEGEKASLRKLGAGPSAKALPFQTITQHFSDTAKSYANEIALVSGDSRISYKELENRVDALACYLASLGCCQEQTIAVALDRSIACYVSVLATLQVGARFLLLDEKLPDKRLSFMLQDADAAYLLTTSTNQRLWNTTSILQISITHDGHINMADSMRVHSAQSSIEKSNALGDTAYLMYTSGSTGEPKAVIGTHLATLNRLQWMWSRYPFNKDDICVHKTALSFVDAIWELFGPLLQGIPTVILSDDDVLDVFRFMSALEAYRITRVSLIPSLLSILLDSEVCLQEKLSHLKQVVVSGEPLSTELAKRFHNKLGETQLINLYGSTEITADVTYSEITPNIASSRITVGRPIDGVQVLLLDQSLSLVPQGSIGEICVAGNALSAGYHNRPALQYSKFIPNPYGSGKLFRTGDLGRFQPDGQLEHCGRNDTQLKVKGQRLEASEIEHNVFLYGGIKQCSVGVSRTDALYLCFEQPQQQSIDVTELGTYLQSRLPRYMQPEIILGVASLPTLPNGKLDREAIARLSETTTSTHAHRYNALTDTEAALLSIWREVLSRDDIDLTADFFDIGGNSVSAMRIVLALNQVDIPLDLSDVLQIGSIRQLAVVADSKVNESVKVNADLREKVSETLAAQNKAAQLMEKNLAVNNPHARYKAETENEQRLLSIWQKILKKEQVDLRADFYDVGGNSILAMQIMVEAKQLGLSLSLREIVDNGCIEQLAKVVKHNGQNTADKQFKSITAVTNSKHKNKQINALLQSHGHNVQNQQFQWYPLSGSQRGILFHMMMFGIDQPLYGAQGRADLEGLIDHEIFEAAWQVLVNRHDAMRSIILHENLQEPVQVVLPIATQNWQYADLSHLGVNEQSIECERIAANTVNKLIAIDEAPLLRVTLIKLSSQVHHFIIDFHHIMFDGWSVASLSEELALAYKALVHKIQPKFKPCGQFQQHVAALDSQDTNKAKEFWRNDLAGFTQPSSISSMRAQSEYYATGNHRIKLDKKTTSALNNLAKQCRVTPNTLIQAAWSIVLSRRLYTEDVLYGFAVTGRSSGIQNYESAIGMFVNTLPMRVQCKGTLALKAFLQKLQYKLLSLIELENTPLVDILQVSELDSHAILFDSLLVFQNVPAPWDDPDMPFQVTNRHNHENSHLPLTIEVFPEDELRVLFLYIPEYCSEEFVSGISLQFRDAMQSMINVGPEGLVADIARTSPEQIKQRTKQFNDTFMDYPMEKSFIDLIWEQSAKSPSAIAVSFDSDSLCYANLIKKADAFATYLRAQNIGMGTLVGICVPRSLDMLIALLAVGRSGATYIPIDPEYPDDRINHIVADSGLTHFISVQSVSYKANVTGIVQYELDTLWPHIHTFSDNTPWPKSDTSSLAYVIYTSGSTGLPKGVKVTQRNVTNFLQSMRRKPGITSKDSLLAVTTVSFDIAVLELYLPLICGARVDIASQATVYDSFSLANRIQSESINYMQATPTTWRLLMAAGWTGSDQFKALVGGEALPRDLCQMLLPITGELWNMYGPTETTVWSTCGKVRDSNSTITIGKPIANTEILIMDTDDTLCPINKPGELYIAGDGVSIGYHERDQLNEAKFIQHPFDSSSCQMVFKTGDMARWLDNGEIECLGRVDRQVKLHGHRVEPGEIESILNSIDSVSQSVVQFYKSDLADRLVAYVVMKNQATDNVTNNVSISSTNSTANKELIEPQTVELGVGSHGDHLMRQTLREKLPEYMMPAAFVRLDVIPLLPNGKIDYLSLPDPFANELSQTHNAIQIVTNADDTELSINKPVSQTEKKLCDIFQNTLRISSISINSNFFDIGGNSLIAMQIIAACGRENIEMGIAPLFELGTIKKLSVLIDTARDSNTGTKTNGNIESLLEDKENTNTDQASHSNEDLLRITELLNDS